jgi:hypothetical protein
MAAAMLADAFGITHALFEKQKTASATRLFASELVRRSNPNRDASQRVGIFVNKTSPRVVAMI